MLSTSRRRSAYVLPGDLRTARLVRSVFAIVILLFLAQLAFVSRFEEPYPALTMPGFAGTGQDQHGDMRISNTTVVVSFTTGDEATLTPRDLLAQAPSSHVRAMARWFEPLAPDRGARRSTGWLASTVRVWIPGFRIREDQFGADVTPAMRRWLGRRLAAMYPDRDATRVEFVWYEERFRFTREEVIRRRAPIGTRVIELSDAYY